MILGLGLTPFGPEHLMQGFKGVRSKNEGSPVQIEFSNSKILIFTAISLLFFWRWQ